MDRNFLKQSIRRELDYYKDGLFNEDEDEILGACMGGAGR